MVLLLLLAAIFFYDDMLAIHKSWGDGKSLSRFIRWDYKYNVSLRDGKNLSRISQWDHKYVAEIVSERLQQPLRSPEIDWSWMDTTGITIKHIQGDPNSCQDLIYTGYNFDATVLANGPKDFVHATVIAHSFAVKTFPMLNQTCFAFFQVSEPFLSKGQTVPLHPVWGRVPATALMMTTFPKANFLLYLDADAAIAFPDQTPTTMYQALSFDGYGDYATFKQLQPGLIVSKPVAGWLCGICAERKLRHGCFNSGALLWHRSEAAKLILHAWWESRHSDHNSSFVHNGAAMHGWNEHTQEKRWGDQQGEQNRLMYIFGTNRSVHKAIWPVPRPLGEHNRSSCPASETAGFAGLVPCLQNEAFLELRWNTRKEDTCYVLHYLDKLRLINHTSLMLQDVGGYH